MTITLTTTPTYALPNPAVQVTASVALPTTCDFIRLWCVAAPEGSTLYKQLQKTESSRVQITPPNAPVEGGILPEVPFSVTLDVGGRYIFVGQEYEYGATTYGGGYSNAPAAYTPETKLGAEQTLYVYIGQRMTQRIGATTYGTAALLVYVWNDTIRETTSTLQGVVSPAIISPSSPRASSAAQSAGVLTQLLLFRNAAVSTLAPNLQPLVAELVTKIPQHMTNDTNNWHADPFGLPAYPDLVDSVEIENLSTRCETPLALAVAVRTIASWLKLHQANGYSGQENYHNDPDVTNAFVTEGAGDESDPAVSLATLADIVRVYEAHRVDATSHTIPDVVHSITTVLGPLLTLHKEFLSAMATLTPTASGGEQTGTVQLSALGFKLG